jgi:3-methyladenine DNA glycosylase AlkD
MTTRDLGEGAVTSFRKRFRAEGRAERAAQEKRYMKSDLSFHGVDMAAIRRGTATFLREHEAAHGPIDRDALVGIVSALFATEWFDLRSAGIDLLERRVKLLGERDLPWLLSLVRRSPYWAHVDWLAAKIIGPILQDRPAMKKTLRAWAKDDDFWVRRTALLAQLVALRTGGGDFALFESIAVPMLGEREFFLRKAIGWVLREVGKKRPALVRAFIAAHGDAMSGLSRREAEKGLKAKAAPRRAAK